ncbi:MAG: glutamate synthase subunit alpha, partial [Pseudomonadota bacterium]
MAKHQSLHRNARAHCGVGLIADLNGDPTHDTIRDGLKILANLDHRSARGAEHNTGDGAGVLIQKPHEFFVSQVDGLGDFDDYGVGMVFFPMQVAARDQLVAMMEKICLQQNFEIVAWREVPTDNSNLGATALTGEPLVEQFFVKPMRPISAKQLDANLFILRRQIEKKAESLGYDDGRFYICSLDRRKIVYKGMLTCNQVKSYYLELSDERVTSSLILVHSRFSTNTLGAWDLAHPYRTLVHNG